MTIFWTFQKHGALGHFGISALGCVLVILALMLRLYLNPGIDGPTLIFFMPAIMATASMGGLWAGLSTTLFSCAIGDYYLLSPANSFSLKSSFETTSLAAFAVTGVFVAVVCELLRQKIQIGERVNAELQKAHKTTDELAAIVEGSSDAIVGQTLKGDITSWNKSSVALFGYTATEAIGSNISMLIPPALHLEEECIVAEIALGHTISHFETSRLRKDGSAVDVSVTISPVRDARGAIIGASKIVRDITARKAQEQQKALLSSVIESSNDAVFTKTLDGTITSWNTAAEAMFSFAAREMIGKPMTILFPLDRIDEEADILKKVKIGASVNHFETNRVRKDGIAIDVSVTISPIRDPHGVVVGASTTMRDITERKRAEKEMQSTRAKLEAALHSMTDAVFISDVDGKLVHINESFATFYRFPDIGECLRSFAEYPLLFELLTTEGQLVPFDRWPVSRALGGETSFGDEYVVRRKDTATSWVGSYTFAPIRDHDGKIIGSVGAARDITQQRATEARLETMRASLARVGRLNDLSQISAGLAHELNQPLSAMHNYSVVAKRFITNGDHQSLEKAHDAISKAADQAVRAGDIIQRMRAFIERPGASHAIENINVIVEEAMAVGLMGAPAESVTTHLELAPDAPTVFVDRVQIQQVLVNLLRNAAEAMAASPTRELTISTKAIESSAVEVAVTDTGPGIPSDIAENLFMPFVTTKPGGMGIGLVISQSIIEAHGGRIQVAPNPGGGTRFHFRLPSTSIALGRAAA